MTGTTFGILLVVFCAFLEGLGQVFLKKSVLTKVRWFMWISAGVVVLALQALIYTEALKLLDVSVAFTILSLNLIAITVLSHCDFEGTGDKNAMDRRRAYFCRGCLGDGPDLSAALKHKRGLVYYC